MGDGAAQQNSNMNNGEDSGTSSAEPATGVPAEPMPSDGPQVPVASPTRSEDWLHRSMGSVEQSWEPGSSSNASAPSAVGEQGVSAAARFFATRVPVVALIITIAVALILCVGVGSISYSWFGGKADTLSRQLQDTKSQLAAAKKENEKAGDKTGSLASQNDKLTKANKDLSTKNDELTKENEQLKSASSAASASGQSSDMIQIVSFSEQRQSADSHELHITVRNNTQVTFDQASVTYVLRDASGNQVGGNHYSVETGTLAPGGTMDTYEMYVSDVPAGLTAVPMQWSASNTQNKTYINGQYGSGVMTYTLQK